jgi:hypothetical protein
VNSVIGCAGRSGDADIRPTPTPATTDDTPTNHESLNSEDLMPGHKRSAADWFGLPERCEPGRGSGALPCHEDNRMMGQFAVAAPAQVPPPVDARPRPIQAGGLVAAVSPCRPCRADLCLPRGDHPGHPGRDLPAQCPCPPLGVGPPATVPPLPATRPHLPYLRNAAVSTTGPSSVIATVCSEWAVREPSAARIVQPSGSKAI